MKFKLFVGLAFTALCVLAVAGFTVRGTRALFA